MAGELSRAGLRDQEEGDKEVEDEKTSASLDGDRRSSCVRDDRCSADDGRAQALT
jgi:hypothetical protein